MELTEQQKKVVNSKSKRILVLSCAGSGKTTVIVNRIARLWSEGVAPDEILVLTFSNKAAQEMRKRIIKEEYETGKKVTVKTFHAFGYDIIKRDASVLGYDGKIKIARSNDTRNFLKEYYRKNSMPPLDDNDILSYIKKAKSFEPYQKIPALENIVSAYNHDLRKKSAVDMDDMIALPVALLESNLSIRELLLSQYKYVFVDEYQDTNEGQNRLLDLITSAETHLCLVGDDDQAIYEWRGARPDYIKEKAVSGEYECLKLEENFRSQGEIILVANKIISNNQNRVSKKIKAFREFIVLFQK